MAKKTGWRSVQWFGRQDIYGFIYRSWTKNRGVPQDQFDGRPAIGICNTWSELTPCNTHFRVLADHVRHGILEAGGFPLEFPVMSTGETLMRPTAMLYRNLAAMSVEESIRANPLDGVVLLAGCDKTTPATIMGAASVDLPTILVSGGPMLSGKYRGTDIGSGTNVWSMSEDLRAGKISLEEFHEAESCMHRSHGHCMTMGTASTMASMVEALGLGMPGNAAWPAVDARRNVLARAAGRRIVDLVKEKMTIKKILSKKAFENAIRANAAIGGSTNAVIHLIAIARRLGVNLTLDDWQRVGEGVHTIVNLMPSGKYLMEDFCYAGGLPAVLRELGENNRLHKDAMTVNGQTIWENNRDAPCWNRDVIFPFKKPFKKNAGIKVLRGNLAPDGAIIKPSAATPKLLKHKGRAVVFENIEDFHKRIDDPKLDIDERCVMVLKNCGPKGYPGMAEVGNMPLPPKLLKKGVTDMLRISDARMSGTAYGSVVLHMSPEAAAGGLLALVQNGDIIEMDVSKGRLELMVSPQEIKKRKARWKKPKPQLSRGYWRLYFDHVNQAHEGADLDFLVGAAATSSHVTTTKTEFTLYCFAQSGNAYKAALMLNLCGAQWTPRFVDFFNGETRTPEYRASVNEMGEVPVLEHAGKRRSQSGVILHYLADHFRKFQGEDREEVLRWILWDNHKLTSYIATLRYFIQFMKTGETPVTEFLRGRIKGSLGILDLHLKKQKFIAGNQPSIADFSACGYLYWPEEFGVSWADFPAVGAWLGHIKALPGWVHPYELMPGHPLPGKK